MCADEFSSQGSEKDYQSSVLTQCPVITQPPAPPVDVAPSIGRCKALYEYTANLYDELNLQPGVFILPYPHRQILNLFYLYFDKKS